jgi:hypothetical protein
MKLRPKLIQLTPIVKLRTLKSSKYLLESKHFKNPLHKSVLIFNKKTHLVTFSSCDYLTEPVQDADNISDTKSVNSDQNALFYEQEIARLKSIISLQNSDNLNLETKMTENELLAKQRCEELEQNFTLKLEQTLKNFKEGQNEKTSSLVMKYAQGEKKLIELNRSIDSLKRQLGESDKEKQRLNERFEKSKIEKEKLNVEYEKKILEIMLLKKGKL